jgi:hypothetical protein
MQENASLNYKYIYLYIGVIYSIVDNAAAGMYQLLCAGGCQQPKSPSPHYAQCSRLAKHCLVNRPVVNHPEEKPMSLPGTISKDSTK